MNRTRVRPSSLRPARLRRRRTVAILVALVLAVPVAATAAGSGGPGRDFQRYTVRPGDTLWSIAQAQGESDPRALVDAISRENPDASSLVPGEILRIPNI